MATVIEIDNLSKKYLIKHQGRKQSQTIRDMMTEKIANFIAGKSVNRKEEFWALKNIGLKVKKGERVAIIGRNGSGKSTLLKIISRITEPTSGIITLYGRTASLLEVGTGFHSELTGRENIYLNGAILGMSKAEIERKFVEIVEFSEIGDFIDTPVKRYSSGMQVKLAFSVAAHLQPDILIIDEVLAVGDYQFQRKCLGKMDEISRGGRTIFFVSHNLEIVQQLCERVIVLAQGEKVFDGDTENGISFYLDSMGNQQFIDARNIERAKNLIGQVFIFDIELLGNQKFLYQIGELVKIRIHLRGNKKISNFYIKVVLMSADEKPVGIAMGVEPLSINKGEEAYYTVGLNTNDLAPGRYLVGIMVSKELNDTRNLKSTYDYLKNVAGFELFLSKNNDEPNMVWNRKFGSVRLKDLQILPE